MSETRTKNRRLDVAGQIQDGKVNSHSVYHMRFITRRLKWKAGLLYRRGRRWQSTLMSCRCVGGLTGVKKWVSHAQPMTRRHTHTDKDRLGTNTKHQGSGNMGKTKRKNRQESKTLTPTLLLN